MNLFINESHNFCFIPLVNPSTFSSIPNWESLTEKKKIDISHPLYILSYIAAVRHLREPKELESH